MLGKFFNSFYYGKSGKGDFTQEDLPDSRVRLFFEMLRIHWGNLVKLNLLYVLFLLPALLWTAWNYLALENVVAMAEVGEILEGELGEHLLSIVSMWLLILWPCIAITGPATAGVTYIARNWARDQHCFLLSDFKDAFLGNWKQGLVTSAITGLTPFLVFLCYRFYGELSATQGVLFAIPQMGVVILGILWLLSLQLTYMMMVTYKLSLGQLLRNALVLSVGKLPLSLGIRLLSLLVPGLCALAMFLIPGAFPYALLVLVAYFVLFGFSFNRFLYASYANALCETYVNPRIEGAEVGIGLRQTTEDDYEIDPTLPQPTPSDDQSQP